MKIKINNRSLPVKELSISATPLRVLIGATASNDTSTKDRWIEHETAQLLNKYLFNKYLLEQISIE